MRLPSPARLFWISVVAMAVLLVAGRALVEAPWLQVTLEILFVSVAVLALLVLSARVLRWLLWRVGRRLAFSYFLIGVLPIPMVLLLGGIALYLLSGYFLGHEYRSALADLRADLRRTAEATLDGISAHGTTSLDSGDDVALALYSNGRRVAGSREAPELWPAWVEAGDGGEGSPAVPFWALPDRSLTVAASAGGGSRGVLAFHRGPVEAELSRRSSVWVTLLDASDRESMSAVQVQLGTARYALANVGAGTDRAARDAFLGIAEDELSWSRRPLFWWGEVAGPVHSLADGGEIAPSLTASLNSNFSSMRRQFFSSSAELNAAVWASLIAVTGLVSSIYLIAVLMALFMILSLSRAVNRLSRATETVRAGDFSHRIPVRRKDQIGELQRSFNEMTGDLESLIDTAAQKELLEKELEIARDLQESLLPTQVPTSERVEFSTLFEPSAAIGGDYFDILRIDDDRLAVVIADVSGHGLPTGLRMAMLKAALTILVEEKKPPSEILRRLSTMIRAEQRQRFFVTATIAVVDFRSDRLEITNAGHPPTYLLRDGEVEEVLLAGSPLGALDENYQQRTLDLLTGDVVVWLSDGLIEAADEHDEPFGYDATAAALAGPAATAEQVRDRLLAAIGRHCGEVPPEDDRTLVAMRYFPGAGAGSGAGSGTASTPRNE